MFSNDIDFMIKGLFSYQIFGQEVWITTTHVCTLIVMLILVIFAICANRVIKKAQVMDTPGTFQNIAELIVEMLDGMVTGVMGKNAAKFANYISTIFMFILLSNISGLLGLRPPTADYGVTFPMGVITFCLIFFNKLKHQKLSGFLKGLCDPWPIWAPINIVGDVAVPISLSLRLFANVLSGTVMMALYYGLLPIFVKIGIPSALHVYFDLFSGAIQTYVFCMLTMTYITDAIGDN
ncbi:MAG: F0F1 ATP synthase subunit A [Lachnospiraceae bacterium]|nr:F0F1 ATP synthase subunit A [Lachnospiraceae bacterium]MCR4684434.1 F0F1 ATP synthase subunit A [Lachnospiraceae bacterium]